MQLDTSIHHYVSGIVSILTHLDSARNGPAVGERLLQDRPVVVDVGDVRAGEIRCATVDGHVPGRGTTGQVSVALALEDEAQGLQVWEVYAL